MGDGGAGLIEPRGGRVVLRLGGDGRSWGEVRMIGLGIGGGDGGVLGELVEWRITYLGVVIGFDGLDVWEGGWRREKGREGRGVLETIIVPFAG